MNEIIEPSKIVINRLANFAGGADFYAMEPTRSWIRQGMANNGVVPPEIEGDIVLSQVKLDTGEVRWIIEWA
jgi:hypothetical protein